MTGQPRFGNSSQRDGLGECQAIAFHHIQLLRFPAVWQTPVKAVHQLRHGILHVPQTQTGAGASPPARSKRDVLEVLATHIDLSATTTTYVHDTNNVQGVIRLVSCTEHSLKTFKATSPLTMSWISIYRGRSHYLPRNLSGLNSEGFSHTDSLLPKLHKLTSTVTPAGTS